MLSGIIKLILFKRKWRKKNRHNSVGVNNVFNVDLVEVGKASYGMIHVVMHNNINRLIIGNYCSIGGECVFVVSGEHYFDRISTFPFKVKCLEEPLEGVSKGDIIIKDDVWIGYRSIILSGITIGQGAVIAAGSVVTKDVPPYAIVGGNPARVIKYRFDENIREKLCEIDFSKLNKEFITHNIERLYSPILSTKDALWFIKQNK